MISVVVLPTSHSLTLPPLQAREYTHIFFLIGMTFIATMMSGLETLKFVFLGLFIALDDLFFKGRAQFNWRGYVSRLASTKGTKVAVVTGGNGGLGFATAELLAKTHHVVIACRSAQRGEDACRVLNQTANNPCIALPLDLSDLTTVRPFVTALTKILKQHDTTLDVIVANAGVMGAPISFTTQGFTLQMGTNHFGHALLIESLEEVMGGDSRIVLVSSAEAYTGVYDADSMERHDTPEKEEAAAAGYQRYRAYSNSKMANIVFAEHLVRKRAGGSRVFVLHPGCLSTNITRNMGTVMTSSFIEVLAKLLIQITPQEGAAYVHRLCVDKSIKEDGWYHLMQHAASPSKNLTQTQKETLIARTYAGIKDFM